MKEQVNSVDTSAHTEEPAAWIYPSDLEKFASQETFATVFSVQVGCPDEISVPLYTRPATTDDLVKALQALYNAIDSCVDLTPSVLAQARAALARATGQVPT